MNLDQITAIGVEALNKSLKVHDELGESGLQKDKINAFGDQALRADWECEEAVIQTLRKHGVAIRVYSEEHGVVDILPEPTLLGVLDGIDGTAEYKKARGTGRYGTMFGIFSNIDPQYKDYLFSGVMEHSAKALFHASKGKGTFVRQNDAEKRLSATPENLFIPQKIYVDYGSYEVHGAQGPKLSNVETLESSACHYTDFVSGKAKCVIESMRKGNLEIAAAFGLVAEAYRNEKHDLRLNFMATLDGADLGQRKYLDFAQKKGKATTIVTGQGADYVRHMCAEVKRAFLGDRIFKGLQYVEDKGKYDGIPVHVEAEHTEFFRNSLPVSEFNRSMEDKLLRQIPENSIAAYISTEITDVKPGSKPEFWDDFEPSPPADVKGRHISGKGECIAIVPKNSDR